MAEDRTGASDGGHDGQDGGADEPLPGGATGPLADEARKLLSAVQGWAQRTMPEPPSGHGGPECQWCPLCQFASILRGEHPEVTERVVEAGAALASALRALADTAVQKAGPSPRGASRPGEAGPAPRVQRIRLDDLDGES